MNKKNLIKLTFLLLLIIGTILIIRQQHEMPYQHNSGFIFGTVYNISYQCDHDLQKEIEAELMKVDNSLSPFNEQSVISKVNRNEEVKLNNMFLDVFTLAEKISKETDGAFDITVAPLVNAWGFGFKQGIDPTQQVIDSLRQIVGYQKVSLTTDSKTVKKQDPRIMLDCSAIAKGYGCDVVARLLKRNDIQNFMVEIGGEVVTRGVSDKRVPWRIGVTKPTDDTLSVNNEMQTVLNVTNKAMATSGNYRNFYYKGGKKYAHTIDPKTGKPVQHNILSATVLANDCATADAYATSFMVLGFEGTQRILDQHPELMAYLIYTDEKGAYSVWYSPSMEDKIVEK
jgi:thiamine biosynthesis lipoprotein